MAGVSPAATRAGMGPRDSAAWRHAFVAAFAGAANDERPMAEEAAKWAGVAPTIVEIGRDDATREIDRILEDNDDINGASNRCSFIDGRVPDVDPNARLLPGTYYLRVSFFSTTTAGTTLPYQLEVVLECKHPLCLRPNEIDIDVQLSFFRPVRRRRPVNSA